MVDDSNIKVILDQTRPTNCARCGNALNYEGLGRYSCKKCGNIEMDDYGKVREYLDENSNAPIIMIEAATGVSADFIKKMLDEGLIEITGDSPVHMTCHKCGKPIRFGRYCPECTLSLANGLKDALSERQHETNAAGEILMNKGEGSMHYVGKNKK